MKLGWKIWLLILVVVFAIIAIRPSFFKQGVVITSVEKNTTAFENGLKQGDIIIAVNGQPVKNVEDYSQAIGKAFEQEKVDNLTKIIFTTKASSIILYVTKEPEITVAQLPHTALKTGLDLAGGARALVKPEQPLSAQAMEDLVSITSNRLNVFGLKDVQVSQVTDLSGARYMLVEIAGATPADIKDLVSKQGKFEARIGNETVFVGGNEDITNVCRNDATCAGIETCDGGQGSYICRFRFTVYLSPTAAQRHADITKKLKVNATVQGGYLEKNLDLIIDNETVDTLLISSDLKGRVTAQISIQGSGTGITLDDARKDAYASMNKLQTILITGSIPYKLEIVKLDTISPVLGGKFIQYIILAGLCSIIAVSLIVFGRYRNIKLSLAILATSFSEIIIILGLAAFIKWDLDLPSIAGILTVIGTGVDQQIVILDESKLHREKTGIIERLKRALFIVVATYFTALASLLPLYWAGAGLLRGFAVTTIMGITVGVLITRPAFVEMIRKMEN